MPYYGRLDLKVLPSFVSILCSIEEYWVYKPDICTLFLLGCRFLQQNQDKLSLQAVLIQLGTICIFPPKE